MNRNRIAVAALILAVLAIPALAGSTAAPSLSLVPRDAVSVGVVKVSDLRSSQITSRLFEHTDGLAADGEAWNFMQETGLRPAEDVDTVVFALIPVSNLGDDGKALMMFEGRFDAAKLAAAVMKREGTKKSSAAGTYYLLPTDEGEHAKGPAAVAFDRTLVIAGNEDVVVQTLAARKAGGTEFLRSSGLGRDYARIDPSATAWLLVDVQRATRLQGAPRMPGNAGNEGAAIATALKTVSTLAMWGSDTGDALAFEATALSADAETRELLEDLLRGLVAGWRMAAQEKKPEFVQILRKFEVQRSDDAVTISGKIPAEFIKSHMKTAAR
jgi:hypothetical protein